VQTMTVAELRSALQSAEEVPRKPYASERSVHIKARKQELVGLPLGGPLTVAHGVYDTLATMRDDVVLTYLLLSEGLTCNAEICSERPLKALQPGTDRNLILKDEAAAAALTLDTDLRPCPAAVGGARVVDLVGFADCVAEQRWNGPLFQVLSREPYPEFQEVARDQVLQLDRRCLLELACICVGDLTSGSTGALPLDEEFKELKFHSLVTGSLLLVTGRGKDPGKRWDSTGQSTGGTGLGTDVKQGSDAGQAPSKKARVMRDHILKGLRGTHPRTPDNKHICFNFNLRVCGAGAKCKFKHACCKPGEHKALAMVAHNSSGTE
ncbi:unnamed protein product, partial [Symbiodinium sp. CCMP2456]